MKRVITTMCVLVAIAFSAMAQDIQYGLFFANSDVLEVRAMSSADIVATKDSKIANCQITLKFETGAIDIQQIIPSKLSWHIRALVESPDEDPGFDYISFIYSGDEALAFTANTEVPLFKIKFNLKGILKDVALMDNTDPFNAQPNSHSTNPGNSFFNFTGDLYLGNYHNPAMTTDLTPSDSDGEHLNVYPKPIEAGNNFYVQSGLEPGTTARIMITSATGQIISNEEYVIETRNEIAGLNVAAGVYFIQVIVPEQVLVGRCVIK